jgi:hypothetical protein
MSSEPSKKRKRTVKEIITYGEPALFSCRRCFDKNSVCIVMPSSRSSKCASCAKLGKSCVEVSWASLDEIREAKKAQIAEDKEKLSRANAEVMKMMAEVVRRQEEQSELLVRIERNEKTLLLAHERAKAKTVCLLDELDDEDKEERSRKRKRGELVSPEPTDFSSFFVPDGSGSVDWARLDLPGDIPTEPVVLQEGGET